MDKTEFIRQNAPCYIYDKRIIEHNCKQLCEAMPEVQFLYSVKTNPFMQVLQTVACQGFGADAASANEVQKAEEAGIPASFIYYSSPGKTDADLESIWERCIIIADSLSELDRLEQLAAKKDAKLSIGVRIHPVFTMDGSICQASKFGIDEEQLLSADLQYSHLKIIGIHVHLKSQVLDSELLSTYYRNCYALAERLDQLPGIEIQFINFGSGIGVVYDELEEKPVQLDILGKVMQEIHQKNQTKLKAKLLLETGRFVVCHAGTYYTKIIDRKTSHDKTYLVVQNGLNGFLRPTIAEMLGQMFHTYPDMSQEPFYTTGRQSKISILDRYSEPEIVDVVGNMCTALDLLARQITLPKGEIGDIIAISNAGSYGFSLTPLLFASQELPGEYLWNEP